jgi:pyruvate/2-oxoglutarate dehydrogenase complex dihydrolipoamide dehydrogenase (E3) component/uncharacterized membrane protein YdjX (TVP38/TMEM64 family)
MRAGNRGKIAVLLLIVCAIALFFALDGHHYLTLANLKAQQQQLVALREDRPLLVISVFFLAYVVVAALSLPGAAIMTLGAGAIFGFWPGLLIASFASTIGATLAFLSARFLLREWVQERFQSRLAAIDQGLEREGSFYLLTIRLIPLFPFFLVNIAMGLTAMRVLPFYLVSQFGMLPGTALYVNAGVQLARIRGLGDVLSPELIGSLVLLGLFPLIAGAMLGRLRRRRVYRPYRKPKRFDRNLIVIGAGAGGLVSANLAATFRAGVTLIESNEMGGDCLNTGCVPSKALIRSARVAHEARGGGRFGIHAGELRVDFAQVIERVFAVIRQIAPADSVERYTGLGVDVRRGYAKLVDPWTVEIDGGERLTARSIIIAAGGEPAIPDIPGLAQAGYLTSDTMWHALADRETAPERLTIIGGGPIGVELAQAFARLGSRVTLVESGERILPREDEDAAALIAETLRSEGVDIRSETVALRCVDDALVVGRDGGEEHLPYDTLIVAVGRKARLTGYGLEELGVETDKTIGTDAFLQTSYPNIFAVGDVAGPYQFTHFAAHQATTAVLNALFGSIWRFRSDNSVVPRTTFSDPEVAAVGLNELSARAANVPFEIVRYELSHLDRAITEGRNKGFVKLLVKPGKDTILGATIVAPEAGEILAEVVLAMKQKIGLKTLLGTIHAYPTLSEANRFAAGEWRKAHQPARLLGWVGRYHAWRRG